MLVAGFVSEQDNVSKVGCMALFFPNHKEVALREFLCPEGAKKSKSNLTSVELM